MTFALQDRTLPFNPIRLWLDKIFPTASSLDACTRCIIARAVGREVARIMRLRSFETPLFYQSIVDVAGGFLTVVAIDSDIHFKLYEGSDPLDPLPPRPHLNLPIYPWPLVPLSIRLNPTRNLTKISCQALAFVFGLTRVPLLKAYELSSCR
jgi:hypothetical protein